MGNMMGLRRRKLGESSRDVWDFSMCGCMILSPSMLVAQRILCDCQEDHAYLLPACLGSSLGAKTATQCSLLLYQNATLLGRDSTLQKYMRPGPLATNYVAMRPGLLLPWH